MATQMPTFLSLALGALLGLVSALFVSTVRQKQEVTMRFLEKFLEVRAEVVEHVAELTNLSAHKYMDNKRRLEVRDEISKLFYRNYDFLPQTVLTSISLLHACLTEPAHGPYALEARAIKPMADGDVLGFIDRNCLTENSRLYSRLCLRQSDEAIHGSQAIKLHARDVLLTLNRFASPGDLLRAASRFKKEIHSYSDRQERLEMVFDPKMSRGGWPLV